MGQTLSNKSGTIKALLLDQAALVSGVGNWIADEVLFQAGIHPEAVCRTLSDEQTGRLHAALLHVVRTAVAANADGGKFPDTWLFHYRWRKGAAGGKVPGADGGPISFITVGGRTSAVVLARQRKGERKGDSKAEPEAPATGPKKAGKKRKAAD